MGSWITCRCGKAVHTNLFAGEPVFRLIRDVDYDGMKEPAGADDISHLFFEQGIPVYQCAACGRLVVEWPGLDKPVFYTPDQED